MWLYQETFDSSNTALLPLELAYWPTLYIVQPCAFYTLTDVADICILKSQAHRSVFVFFGLRILHGTMGASRTLSCCQSHCIWRRNRINLGCPVCEPWCKVCSAVHKEGIRRNERIIPYCRPSLVTTKRLHAHRSALDLL